VAFTTTKVVKIISVCS